MGAQLRSALLAGFIAGFFWIFLANLFGMDPKPSAWIGLAVLAVTALLTALISATIARRKVERVERR